MRYLLVVLAFLILASGADAQRRGQAIGHEGDLGVTIGFSGLDSFNLSPLEGGLGLRYRVAERTVLGSAVSIGGSENEGDWERESEANSEAQETRFNDSSSRSASLALFVEQHVGKRRSTVSPFVGAAVRFGIRSAENSFILVNEDLGGGQVVQDRRVENRSESDYTSVSGGLLLGGEVKIVNGVTLAGAYTFGVEYTDQSEEQSESITDTRYTDGQIVNTITRESSIISANEGWNFGVGTTQVTLSIYF